MTTFTHMGPLSGHYDPIASTSLLLNRIRPTAAGAKPVYTAVHPQDESRKRKPCFEVLPSMWCVSRENLQELQKEVKEAWENGDIPNSDDPQFHNPTHNDPHFGPTVHQVVEHFIKPKLPKGSSWALERNPNGLQCDTFGTHCWDEGIFEFCTKALSEFPTKGKGMYVCFLSNPQDPETLNHFLDCEPHKSPFAKAIEAASYFIVIPNQKTGIYQRLWCVYEMYLAHQACQIRDLKITLPSFVKNPFKLARIIGPPLTILPAAGFCFGYFFLGAHVAFFLGPVMWLLCAHICGTTLRIGVRMVSRFTRMHLYRPACEVAALTCWTYAELILAGVFGGLSWYHLQHRKMPVEENALTEIVFEKQAYLAVRWEPGEGHGCFILMISIICSYAYELLTILVDKRIAQESELLNFDSIRDARCSRPEDEEHIKAAIGTNDENIDRIDRIIKELTLIGKYDKTVKTNLELGLSPAVIRTGVNPFRVVCGTCSWTFWVVTDLAARKYYMSAHTFSLVASLSVLGVIYGPTTLKEGTLMANDVYLFAVSSFMYFGLAFALTSNHPMFFNDDSVKALVMSIHTIPLQLFLLICMLVVDAAFYFGLYAHVWKCLDEFFGCSVPDVESSDDGESRPSRQTGTTMSSATSGASRARELERNPENALGFSPCSW